MKSMEEKFPELMKRDGPKEISFDDSELKGDLQKLLKLVSEHVKGDLEPLGLGRISCEEDADNECYFVVLNWPSASKFRNLLGLEPYDFHITLAFKSGDIHNNSQRKNKGSLIDPQPQLREKTLHEEELARMTHFLNYLKINPKYAHSFVSLGWVSPQVFQKAELTLLDLGDIGLEENEKRTIWNWSRNIEINTKLWLQEYEKDHQQQQ